MQKYTEQELTAYLVDSPLRNMNANSNNDILQYFITNVKAINAMIDNASFNANSAYRLTSVSFNTQFACAIIENDNQKFHSYYIRQNYRKRGIFKSLVKESIANNETILTTLACQIDSILAKLEANYVVVESFFDKPDAKYAILNAYQDKRAKRSGVLLMNHILEGSFILNAFNLNKDRELEAFALHPILQSDDVFNLLELQKFITNDELSSILILAEDILDAEIYGKTANSLLLNHFENGQIVPKIVYAHQKVKNMLVADKIQNYKDFELYHKSNHQKSEQLSKYFEYWLASLSIPFDNYTIIKKLLIDATTVELDISELS